MKSTDDITGATTAHEELHELGKRIRDWQSEQEPTLSDAQLRNRYPETGSSRTYKRIHTGDGIESLDADEWVPRYREVWNRIESEESTNTGETLYDDLAPATSARAAAIRLMKQSGLQRLVVLEGDTGTGKTSALRILQQRYGKTCHLIESHEGWGRLGTALRCLADGLSIRAGEGPKRPQSAGDWLELIVETLNKRGRRVILIDEAQHWSGEMLNALKTLINRTDCVFVVAAMGTLWQKLTRARYQEAKQLTLNRMLARVKLTGPARDDVRIYLRKRCGLKPSNSVVAEIAEDARTRGGFAFLRRVADKAGEPGQGESDDDIVRAAARDALIDLGE